MGGLTDKLRWLIGDKRGEQDRPDWSIEGDDGWAATVNPDVKTSREQRRAQLISAAMLIALPIAIGSCAVASFALLNTDSGAVIDESTASPEWVVSDASKAAAVTAVWEYMEVRGFEPERVALIRTQQAGVPCGTFDPAVASQPAFGCDRHEMAVWFPDGERLGLVVIIDQTTGQPAFAPSLIPFPINPQWGSGPSWAYWYPSGDPLPDDIYTALEEWAIAWSSNNQRDLLQIAGADEGGERPYLALPGWEYAPNTIGVVSRLAAGVNVWQVSVSLEVRPIVVGEEGQPCITEERAEELKRNNITPDAPTCASGLTIALDLTVTSADTITLVDGARTWGGVRGS